MKNALLLILFLSLSLRASAQALESGIGIHLGSLTGISASLRTGEATSIDAALSYDFGYLDSPCFHADFLFHKWPVTLNEGHVEFFLGPGAGLGFTSDISFSLRAPGGAGYYFNDFPLEIFAELVPTLQLTGPDGVHFWISGYLGSRWYF